MLCCKPARRWSIALDPCCGVSNVGVYVQPTQLKYARLPLYTTTPLVCFSITEQKTSRAALQLLRSFLVSALFAAFLWFLLFSWIVCLRTSQPPHPRRPLCCPFRNFRSFGCVQLICCKRHPFKANARPCPACGMWPIAVFACWVSWCNMRRYPLFLVSGTWKPTVRLSSLTPIPYHPQPT